MRNIKKIGQFIDVLRLTCRSVLLYFFDILCFIYLPQNVPEDKKKVLLVRLDAIGDFVLWLDAAKTLRVIFPLDKYCMTLLGNAQWTPLAEQLSFFDQVLAVELGKFSNNLIYRLKILLKVRRNGYQVVIHPTFSRKFLHGDAVMRVSGAAERIGFAGDCSCINPIARRVSNRWYTRLIAAPNTPLNELETNAFFIRALGLNTFQAGLPELPFKKLPSQFEFKEFFVIFPGAGEKTRQWSLKNFCELLQLIYMKTEWKCVICGGPGEESLAKEIAENVDIPLINLAGRTSLAELAAIVARAHFLVGNETSAIHIAAAVSTPAVCILGGGHYGRFIPYHLEKETMKPLPIVVMNRMECYSCNWHCIYDIAVDEPFPCIAHIPVDKVWTAVQVIIDRITSHPGLSKRLNGNINKFVKE